MTAGAGPLGVYVPGGSLLHRAPAGAKLAGLAAAATAVLLAATPVAVAVSVAVTGAAYAAAGVGWRPVLAQLRPLLWLLVVVGAFQVVVAGAARAGVVVGQLVVVVLLAGLVSLTTRVSAMLDVVERSLRPVRRLVDPQRVALLLALTVRAVPLVVGIVAEVRDAQRARGAGGSTRALVVPSLVRALRTADALGEALAARGVDD